MQGRMSRKPHKQPPLSHGPSGGKCYISHAKPPNPHSNPHQTDSVSMHHGVQFHGTGFCNPHEQVRLACGEQIRMNSGMTCCAGRCSQLSGAGNREWASDGAESNSQHGNPSLAAQATCPGLPLCIRSLTLSPLHLSPLHP